MTERDRIAEFKEVAELMPDDPVVRFGLAGAYLEAGQPEAAVAEYRETIRLKPDYSAAHRGLGRALDLILSGRIIDAQEALSMGLVTEVVPDGPDAALTRALVERHNVQLQPGDRRAELVASLTDREAEILRLVARGLSNQEIADTLVVAVHTVKSHVAHVLGKLESRDRTQAVIVAYETGFIRPGD